MSFIQIAGVFPLATVNCSDAFSYYETNIRCCGNKDDVCAEPIPAEVRWFPQRNDRPIRDNAQANVVAKLYVPDSNGSEPALLDAVRLDIFPGDPSDDAYFEAIPDGIPTVFANGVVSDAKQLPNNSVATFQLTASQYVRNGVKQTTLLCRVDKSNARWKNIRIPANGAHISVVGSAEDLYPHGILGVDILDMGFNPPPNMSNISHGPNKTNSNSPNKRQRLVARVPPRTFTQSSDTTERQAPLYLLNVVPPLDASPNSSQQRNEPSSQSSTETALSNEPYDYGDKAGPSTRAKGKRKADN